MKAHLPRARRTPTWIVVLCAGFLAATVATPQRAVTIEDFQAMSPGKAPDEWMTVKGLKLVPLEQQLPSPKFDVAVIAEAGNRFLRVTTQAKRLYLVRPVVHDFDWDLNVHPMLSWDMRALQHPKGERQGDLGDAGAAVYVTYSLNCLRMPRSIKYLYASDLPVGTVLSYPMVKVLVVASGNQNVGEWVHIERDVAEDYRRLWGDDPPDSPLAVTFGGNATSQGLMWVADFDNLAFKTAL